MNDKIMSNVQITFRSQMKEGVEQEMIICPLKVVSQ